MDFIDDDDEEEICIYSPNYGYNFINSFYFDDHTLLGKEYLKYKPAKIVFWTSEIGEITGIQTWFRNIVNNNYINSGENKGLNSKYKHIFKIEPNEYLTNCRLWMNNKAICKIYLETNLGKNFKIGNVDDEGKEIYINYLKHGNNIIISFLGSYNKLLESFGLHIIEKKEFMKIMFIGFFELKKILKNEEKRNEYMERFNKKEFEYEEEAIFRTCLLPNGPFNEVIKYCIF